MIENSPPDPSNVPFDQMSFVYCLDGSIDTDLIHCGVCFHRKYDQALEYHRQALVLIPQHASTYSSIGYVHSLMGDFESAIDYFHTVRGHSL